MAKQNLKERLKKRRQEIKSRQSGGNVIFFKEGVHRFRVLPTPPDEDWGIEVMGFYLGPDIKGVFSPSSIGEKCPIMEFYNKLVKDPSANPKLKKALVPRKRFLVPVLTYADEKGKKVDEDRSGKLAQIPSRIYLQMIDLFLDPDFTEFNDPQEGFDFKLRREGSGLTSTSYTITPMQPKPIPKGWEKPVDVTEMAREIFPSYEEIHDKLEQFLASFEEWEGDENEDEAPSREKSSVKDRLKRKAKSKSRGDE